MPPTVIGCSPLLEVYSLILAITALDDVSVETRALTTKRATEYLGES